MKRATEDFGVALYCLDRGIAVVTYSSIAQGILTGKFARQPRFKEGDSRPNTVLFEQDIWPHVYEGVERLRPLGDQLCEIFQKTIARVRKGQQESKSFNWRCCP